MQIIQYPLGPQAYAPTKRDKSAIKTIVLHHTAGGPSAKACIDEWNKRNPADQVSTQYVIGRDGVIYQCFSDEHWGYHLGLTVDKWRELSKQNLLKWPMNEYNAWNGQLNAQAIAIEICAFGWLTPTYGGWRSWAGTIIPQDQVYKPEQPFRGQAAFEAYSEAQIATLREFLPYLSQTYGIDLKAGIAKEGLELSSLALSGAGGLYSHTNYRADKSDVTPQLLPLIHSL